MHFYSSGSTQVLYGREIILLYECGGIYSILSLQTSHIQDRLDILSEGPWLPDKPGS